MSKRTKNLIITFSIIGVLAVLMIVFSALFSIRSINVDFGTNLVYAQELNAEDIIKDSGLKKGKNIFFADVKKAESTLEEKYGFGKFKIVRTFPNKLTIHTYERQPAFRLQDEEGMWHLYDEGLKCLAVIAPTNLDASGLNVYPVLHGFDVVNADEGKFATGQKTAALITAILDGIYSPFCDGIDIMTDITLDYDQTGGFQTLELVLRSNGKPGTKILIQGEENLVKKIAFAVGVYFTDVSQDPEHLNHLDKVTLLVLNNFDVKNMRLTTQCSVCDD